MIHPFFCYLSIAGSFVLSFALFITGTVDTQKYFYLPIVLLIGFYTIHAVATDKRRYQKRSVTQSASTATGKYFLWGLVLLAVIGLYRCLPGYRELTTNTQRFFEHLWYAFLVLGWPYFFIADQYRYCLRNVMMDHFITVAMLWRHLKRGQFCVLRRRLAAKRTKRMLVSGR